MKLKASISLSSERIFQIININPTMIKAISMLMRILWHNQSSQRLNLCISMFLQKRKSQESSSIVKEIQRAGQSIPRLFPLQVNPQNQYWNLTHQLSRSRCKRRRVSRRSKIYLTLRRSINCTRGFILRRRPPASERERRLRKTLPKRITVLPKMWH